VCMQRGVAFRHVHHVTVRAFQQHLLWHDMTLYGYWRLWVAPMPRQN
jgi:hypothetical protein